MNDDALGMAWWNNLRTDERLEWLRRADSSRAVDAWRTFKGSIDPKLIEVLMTTKPNGWVLPDGTVTLDPNFVPAADLQVRPIYVTFLPSEPLSGRDAIMRMRDEFLQAVSIYNEVGLFNSAKDAQKMAISLHKFEDDHAVTELVWPLRTIAHPEYGKELATINGTGLNPEELGA